MYTTQNITQMKIRILKPKETAAVAKMTVHKTGKLGFSRGAMEMMNIDEYRFAKFGFDENDRLCVLMFKEADDETFHIAKAGAYYYISARTLLQDLEVDYTSDDTTIFDIRKSAEPDIYYLAKRVIKK